MLRTRVLTAVVLAPIILAIVMLGEPWLSLLVGFVAFLAGGLWVAIVSIVLAQRARTSSATPMSGLSSTVAVG